MCKRFLRRCELMEGNQKCHVNQLMYTLIERVPNDFKFHGEAATNLFLNDQLCLEDGIEICVNRMDLLTVLSAIPQNYRIKGLDKYGKMVNCEKHRLHQIASVEIYENEILLLNIIIYDVDNEEWMFQLNNNIRIPEKQIYYHSLKWNVDYIKPEIVLMYLLHEPVSQKQVQYCRHLIDRMSYYQFITLKVAVGEDLLRKVLTERSTYH